MKRASRLHKWVRRHYGIEKYGPTQTNL